MRVVTINSEDVRHQKGLRLFRCPKCGTWNRVPHRSLPQKILVVACKRCATRYRHK